MNQGVHSQLLHLGRNDKSVFFIGNDHRRGKNRAVSHPVCRLLQHGAVGDQRQQLLWIKRARRRPQTRPYAPRQDDREYLHCQNSPHWTENKAHEASAHTTPSPAQTGSPSCLSAPAEDNRSQLSLIQPPHRVVFCRICRQYRLAPKLRHNLVGP